uniref:NDR1/HIN1-like protein 26 n=1 Tax=Elaeis guineensis var. tenera TaxID=51953 RepID=A0A6I9QJE1_ELAGV|nr:NDR1/HIN1-like protein 26 [Elaeis guineensis]
MCLYSVLLFVLIADLIIFILWPSLHPHHPRFYLSFSTPAVAQPLVGLLNSTISFNVTDCNSNRKIGIYYDVVYDSIYYKNQVVASDLLLNLFFQPPKNTTLVPEDLTGTTPVVGDAPVAWMSSDATAGRFQCWLELKSIIQFQVHYALFN